MDGDVAFGQYRHAGHAAVRFEMMQMDVQQGCTGRLHAVPQRRFDMVDIVETFGVVKVDDEMRTGAPHPVPHHEMIVGLLGRCRSGFDFRSFRDLEVFLSGGTWGPQARPQLEEGLLAHAASSPTRDRSPRGRRTGSTEYECRSENCGESQ